MTRFQTGSFVPDGTLFVLDDYPAINGWAIFRGEIFFAGLFWLKIARRFSAGKSDRYKKSRQGRKKNGWAIFGFLARGRYG